MQVALRQNPASTPSAPDPLVSQSAGSVFVTPPAISRERLLSWMVVVIAIAAVLAHGALLFFYTEDDHYIAARYARNLAAGLGLVFNAGEHEWGCTTTLLPFLQALLLHFGVSPLLAAKGIGLTSVSASCVLAFVLAARFSRPLVASTSAFLVAAFGPLILWAVGGLETSLFGMLVLAALVAAAAERHARPRRISISAILILLAALTRYDALLYLPAVLRARWNGRLADQVRWLALVALGFLALWLAHVRYYDAFLPNSLLSKVVGVPGRLDRGVAYLKDFSLEHRWLLGTGACAAVIAGAFAGPHRAIGQSLGIALLLSLFYPVWTGGDWMPDHRFFAPVVLFAAPLIAMAVGVMISRLRRGAVPWTMVACVGMLALAAQTAREDDRWVPRLRHLRTSNDAFLQLGELVRGGDPTLLYAVADIGGFGWTSDARILDLAGLTDHSIAGAPHTSAGPLPGKVLEARRPDVILVKLDAPDDLRIRRAAYHAMVALDTRQLTADETAFLLSAAHSVADLDAGNFAVKEGHYRVINVTHFLEMDQFYVILAREDAIWRLSDRLRTVRLNGGIAYYEQGERERGLAMLTRELDANPYDVLGLVPQSLRLFAAHDPETAVRLLRRRLEIEPDDLLALINLGYGLGLLDRFAEAVGPLRHALELQPGNAFARQDLEWVLGETRHHWEASPGSDLPPWLLRAAPLAILETETESVVPPAGFGPASQP